MEASELVVLATEFAEVGAQLHGGGGRDYLLFDVNSEFRWPRFTAALAAQTPIRSVLCYQLVAEDSAALNLFGESAGVFGDESITVGAMFAAHVSSAVALYEAEERANNLEAALLSSRRIGAAIGVLMTHHRLTEEQAFTRLKLASQHLHRKLRDVAGDVVATGVLPDLPDAAD